MANYDRVVIGASAGGILALKELVSTLPPDFEAAVFVVQHVSANVRSHLPEILNYAGPLKAVHPQDGEQIQLGRIYVAPPDCHMLIEDDHVVVKKGPKENRFRPSIDALFRSAAYTCGSRVIGIVLTGLLNDGTSGMWSVKRLGGVGIVQNPSDAQYPSMPESVLEYVDVDYAVPVSKMALLLMDLVGKPAPENPALAPVEEKRMEIEIGTAAQQNAFDKGILSIGDLTPLTCPECNGVLVSFNEGRLMRYRCHTGHAYTADALLTDLTKTVEDSLWQTVRGLEESVLLLEQAGRSLLDADQAETAEPFLHKARETRERSRALHEFIYQQGPLPIEK